MAIYNLGRILPSIKGEYNNATEYNRMDIVYYQGSSYVAKDTVTGIAPNNTIHWQMIAAAGRINSILTTEQINQVLAQLPSDVVRDSDYNHTDNNFSDYYKDTIDGISIGNGTLDIKQNGVSKGTFTANQSSNSTINITTPTHTSEIENDSEYITKPTYNESDAVDYIVVNPNNIYKVGNTSNLTLDIDINREERESYRNTPSIIYFSPDNDDFELSVPETAYTVYINMSDNDFINGENYQIIISSLTIFVIKLDSDNSVKQKINIEGDYQTYNLSVKGNKVYQLGNINTLNLTDVEDSIYPTSIYFTAGENANVQFPSGVKFIGEHTFTDGKSYVISIEHKRVVVGEEE